MGIKAVNLINHPINGDEDETEEDQTPLLRNSNSCESLNRSASSTNTLHKYEDFATKLKVRCPTCQGKGKLSQSQADTLVALIPVSDKRLRPRRTKLYLGITVLVSIVAIFLVAFFLLPRSITLSIIDVYPIKIFMQKEKEIVPYIDVKITYEIKNDNFFQTVLESLATDISWNKYILNTSVDATNNIHIGARTKANHTVLSRQVFSDEAIMKKVKYVCVSGWKWNLFEKFVTTATVSYLGRSEELTDTFFGYTSCHNASVFL